MIKILDCTLRDGGHVENWNFSTEFVLNLIEKSNKNNVNYLEIGYRNSKDSDGKGRFYRAVGDFIKEIYVNKKNLQIGVMTDVTRYSSADFKDKNLDYIDFVRVATHSNTINEAIEIVESLKNKGYKTFIQLVDISSFDENGYINLYKWKNKDILESLYFADSYGTLIPEEVEKYYLKLKMLGYKNISFHAHNTKGKALENTLKAIEIGVFSVDVTQNGIGRSGGNLDADTLYKKLKR
jgi:4-hydroxy 2-oxovalerate aldolase